MNLKLWYSEQDSTSNNYLLHHPGFYYGASRYKLNLLDWWREKTPIKTDQDQLWNATLLSINNVHMGQNQ